MQPPGSVFDGRLCFFPLHLTEGGPKGYNTTVHHQRKEPAS